MVKIIESSMSEINEEWTFTQKKSQRNKERRNGFGFETKGTIKCCGHCKRDIRRNNVNGTIVFCTECEGQPQGVELSLNKKKRWELVDKKYDNFQKDKKQPGETILTEDGKKVFVKNGNSIKHTSEEVDILVQIPESLKRNSEKKCPAKEKSPYKNYDTKGKTQSKKRGITIDFKL